MILPTFREERALAAQGYRAVAGVDEVGRGPLAGPVMAGAVVLPERWLRRPRRNGRGEDPRRYLRDSKTLSAAQRERLYDAITACAVAWAVGEASVEEIDRLGIVPATRLAMRRAIDALRPGPQALLVDAVDLSELRLPCRAIIDGDALCGSIAAASIVAKVARDRLMEDLDRRYPGYGFAEHKGYATREHLRLLRELGPCPIHRRTFAPVLDILIRPRLF